MEDTEFLALLEEVLEVDPGSVGMSDDLVELNWDSLAVLGFISAIDEKLDVTLDAARLAKAETPAQLRTLVDDAVAG